MEILGYIFLGLLTIFCFKGIIILTAWREKKRYNKKEKDLLEIKFISDIKQIAGIYFDDTEQFCHILDFCIQKLKENK